MVKVDHHPASGSRRPPERGRLVALLDAGEFVADVALALGVDCAETDEVRADMILARLG